MGVWIRLWTAMGYLCALGQFIMVLDRHWSFMLSLRQKSELASPQLRATNSYGHHDLLPTIGVAFLMCILCACGAGHLGSKLDEHGHSYAKQGWTAERQLLTCAFVSLVALNIFLGLLSGAIVTMFVSVLVVTVANMEHAKYCAKGWTPLVDGFGFCLLLCSYYGFIGLSALLVSIHSFLGWSSETYFTLAVALLLGARYSSCERLNWSDVHWLVSQATVTYVLCKVLSALAVAIDLSAWLSPETFFKLVAALVVLCVYVMLPMYLHKIQT